MDELDKKILKELQLDSRSSFTKIAQRIGLSTATVSGRAKKLTGKGIICGYTALLNTSELGMVTLITKIKEIEGVESVDAELVLKTMKEELKVSM